MSKRKLLPYLDEGRKEDSRGLYQDDWNQGVGVWNQNDDRNQGPGRRGGNRKHPTKRGDDWFQATARDEDDRNQGYGGGSNWRQENVNGRWGWNQSNEWGTKHHNPRDKDIRKRKRGRVDLKVFKDSKKSRSDISIDNVQSTGMSVTRSSLKKRVAKIVEEVETESETDSDDMKTPAGKRRSIENVCPFAPKKVSFANVKDTDSQEEESNEVEEDVGNGTDDPKDQIVKELKVKIESLQRELDDQILSKKKSTTKAKTLDMLSNFGKKNKTLENEKIQLELKIEDLENKIEIMESEGFVRKNNKAEKNVMKLKQILQRVRSERDKQVENNDRIEQENRNLENKVNEIGNALLIKIKSLEDAGSKIEILRKIRDSLEKENAKYKLYFGQRTEDGGDESDVDEGGRECGSVNELEHDDVHEVSTNVEFKSDDDIKESSTVEEEEELNSSKEGATTDDDDDIIDSSNDEPEAKANAKAKPSGVHNVSLDVNLPSDEEYPEEQFMIGSTVVSNYYNSSETIIDYSKIPKDLFEEGAEFQATPCALNNSLIFVASNNNVVKHKFGKRYCGLTPQCSISWKVGFEITQVFILEGDNHPKTGQSVWACHHHASASVKGVKLQCQRYDYKTAEKNVINDTVSTVLDGPSTSGDMNGSSVEDVPEDASKTEVKKRKSLTKRRKGKETTFEEAEKFIEDFKTAAMKK